MLERSESSVLVSLRELGQLEEERVARNLAAERDAAARAEKARLDAEHVKEEEHVRQRRELMEAMRIEAERTRLEETKVQAARDAAVEAARVAAAAEAKLAEMRVRQEHELRLADLRRASSIKRWTFVHVALATLIVVGGAATWRFVANERRAESATIDDLRRSNDARQAGIALAEARLDAHAREVARLEALLAAPLPVTAQTSQSRQPPPVPSPPSQHPTHHSPTTPLTPATCSPHDPLCAKIP